MYTKREPYPYINFGLSLKIEDGERLYALQLHLENKLGLTKCSRTAAVVYALRQICQIEHIEVADETPSVVVVTA